MVVDTSTDQQPLLAGAGSTVMVTTTGSGTGSVRLASRWCISTASSAVAGRIMSGFLPAHPRLSLLNAIVCVW